MKSYSLFYYIPWPDSQRYQAFDDDEMFTSKQDEEGGIYADKDWVNELEILYGI